jgi:hypothetical protein
MGRRHLTRAMVRDPCSADVLIRWRFPSFEYWSIQCIASHLHVPVSYGAIRLKVIAKSVAVFSLARYAVSILDMRTT